MQGSKHVPGKLESGAGAGRRINLFSLKLLNFSFLEAREMHLLDMQEEMSRANVWKQELV